MTKLTMLLFAITFLTMCNSPLKNKKLLYDLRKAKDAFDYPNLNNNTDTAIFIYQLRDILSRRDSFAYVNNGVQYLEQFKEQNLSLRPQELETFRFSYAPFKLQPINITFNKTEIIVKRGTSGRLYPVYNENKLDSLELFKFRFMGRNLFYTRASLSENRRKYYDSLETKYPELKSILYYQKLINKCIDYDSANFKFSTNRIPITDEQYASLIDSLKKSGFDNLPWKIEYPAEIADGGGYTIEANTKTKFKYFVCFGLPIDTLPMTNFCRFLLQVAKIDKEVKL